MTVSASGSASVDSALPQPTDRAQLWERLAATPVFDLIVVGGGATGLGVALDAAARGFSVVLLEAQDFAKGTSSRATKLVHGGVRYLAQGNIGLVREALHERTTLLRNAPHLAQPLPFVVPAYRLVDGPFYAAGLKAYDLLAGKAGLGATQLLSRTGTVRRLPTVRQEGLKGGVQYWDGQFDDARLALALARTAAQRGALVLNYAPVESLVHADGRVVGVRCRDVETGATLTVHAKAVVNATGVWVDGLRAQDGEATGRPARAMVAPSQGVHLVVDHEFLPGDHALMVPKTSDGRVLFAVPWLGKVILGTTDSLRQDVVYEPLPQEAEIDFILREAGRYLSKPPQRKDVRSVWVGLRPLVRPTDETKSTKAISREHTVITSPSGLVTVTGGKWTTYRAMAEDVLSECFEAKLLPMRAGGVTVDLPLCGAPVPSRVTHRMSQTQGWHSYGAEAARVQALVGKDHWLAPGLSEAMVRFAVQHEYARTVEDVLARRSRLLFLDAGAARQAAPEVATLLQTLLARQEVGLDAFLRLTAQYLLT